MDWYIYVCWVLIISQAVFLILPFRNYTYALAKHKKRKFSYSPRTAVIIPCKDLDENFEQNISSFYKLDYEDYVLLFVVGDQRDSSYGVLCELKGRLDRATKAKGVRVVVAGMGQTCSQKIHNLLYAYKHIPSNTEVVAFADSDICVRPDWLSHLVDRLRKEKNGVTSGYRWYVPKRNNFATLALVAINGKIAQLLGNTWFNHVWGGSMAIKVETFRELGMEAIWQKAVSDDLSLSCAVKDAHKKVEFVPGCIVATHESTSWGKLFEFGRRQFVITKVAAPQTWTFGLVSSVYAVFGLWGGTGLAIYAGLTGNRHIYLFAAVPILFFGGQLTRAILREGMIGKLLSEERAKLKTAGIVDILFFWLWSPIMLVLILSSAFGRTIRWRGIRYKLVSAGETIVLGP